MSWQLPPRLLGALGLESGVQKVEICPRPYCGLSVSTGVSYGGYAKAGAETLFGSALASRHRIWCGVS